MRVKLNKKSAIILFLTLISVASIHAQSVFEAFPKKSNVITITTENTLDDALFDTAIKVLMQNGITIDDINKPYGYFQTNFEKIKGQWVAVSFHITVSDHTLYIRGRVKNTNFPGAEEKAANTYGIMKQGWKKMISAAEMIQGKTGGVAGFMIED